MKQQSCDELTRCDGLRAQAYSELRITKYDSITSCHACAHQAKVVDFNACGAESTDCFALHSQLSWRCPQVNRVVKNLERLRQYCEKSNHKIKYLRSRNYKEGSSESQKRVLGYLLKKHSYDNKTGLEDLYAAVGGGIV